MRGYTPLLIVCMLLGSAASTSSQKILFSFLGKSNNDRFGWVARAAGDLNRDGFLDIALSSHGGIGKVEFVSGEDGKLVYSVAAPGTRKIGHSLRVLGDVDKDGFPDFSASAPSYANPAWEAYVGVFSGKNGKTICKVRVQEISYPVVDRVGDIDRVGIPDLAIGIPGIPARIGSVYVFSLAPTFSLFKTFGTACTSASVPPTLRALRESRIDQNFTLEVSNLKTGTFGGLIVGFSDKNWWGQPLPLDLTPIGMKGCNLWVSWFMQVPMWSGGGSWRWTVKVPFDYTLVGAPFFVQCYVPDRNANALVGGGDKLRREGSDRLLGIHWMAQVAAGPRAEEDRTAAASVRTEP